MRRQPAKPIRGIAIAEQFFQCPFKDAWHAFKFGQYGVFTEDSIHSLGPHPLEGELAKLRKDYSTPDELKEYIKYDVFEENREFWHWVCPETMKFIFKFHWIQAGPKDAFTRIHVDPFGSASWTAVISGRKRFYLYPPEARDMLTLEKVDRAHAAGMLPTFQEDFRKPQDPAFPNFKHTQEIQVEVDAGDVMVIPADWAYADINLEETVCVSENFVTAHEAPVFFHYIKKWLKEEGFYNEMANIRWQIVHRHLVKTLKKQMKK